MTLPMLSPKRIKLVDTEADAERPRRPSSPVVAGGEAAAAGDGGDCCPDEDERPAIGKGRRSDEDLGGGGDDDKGGSRHDTDYFRGYEDLSLHLEMIRDYPRTQAYREAILKNYRHFYKKVVLDVGAGTGILSVFCVQAGARKVYAVEASSMAEHATQVAKENGMEDRIVVIKGKIEDVDLPEKVDVIVSEWMGYCLLHESMLKSVISARDRFLKKGGYMYPDSATVYAAPFTDEEAEDEWADAWDDVSSLYKVKMSCLKAACATAKEVAHIRSVEVDLVNAENVVAHAAVICTMDLASVPLSDVLSSTQGNFAFNCFGRTKVHGLVAWFTVAFPGGIVLSTSPYSEPTHWCQSLFLFKPIPVEQDSLLNGCVTLSYDDLLPRHLTAAVRIETDGGELRLVRYRME